VEGRAFASKMYTVLRLKDDEFSTRKAFNFETGRVDRNVVAKLGKHLWGVHAFDFWDS